MRKLGVGREWIFNAEARRFGECAEFMHGESKGKGRGSGGFVVASAQEERLDGAGCSKMGLGSFGDCLLDNIDHF